MKKNRLTSKQFKSAIVLLSLVLGYTISFSQNTYEKGYYVTNTSDTIRGYIDIRESMGNPLQLKFKKQQDQSNQQTLSVNEVASFLLENFAIYERFFVSLSMNDIRMGRSESLVETPSRKDTVFLKLLSKGKFLSLYSFRDDLKERFYIMPSNETIPVELIYEIKRILNGGKRIQETYKQQLYTEAAKAGRLTEDLQWKLKKARCDAHSLTNLVFYINESTESPAIKSLKLETQSVFYGGAGLEMTNLNYSGSTDWTKTSSPSYGPYFSVGIKLMPNTYRRKFSARAEVLVRSSSFKTVAHYNGFTSSTSDIVHTFNQLNTAITLAFDYRIFTVKKTRFFLGGGFRFNLPSYSNNVIYPSSYAPNGFAFGPRYYSFSIRTGFQFSKRMECLIEYNFNSTRLSDLNYVFLWDLSMSGPKIGLNYFINPK